MSDWKEVDGKVGKLTDLVKNLQKLHDLVLQKAAEDLAKADAIRQAVRGSK